MGHFSEVDGLVREERPCDADGMAGSALFSPNMMYRYKLVRTWAEEGRPCTFIMLNPSTADAFESDPTVTRCLKYAKAWGFGSLTVLNLFALRATDPKELYNVRDPHGPDNARIIGETIGQQAGNSKFWTEMNDVPLPLVVCAWGSLNIAHEYGKMMVSTLKGYGVQPCALKLTKEGFPGHPLYLKADLKPQPWSS